MRLAHTVETLDNLFKHDQVAETFDMEFIDTDKESYLLYYERMLRLLRPGGSMFVDNVLWGDLPADPEHHDSNTDAIWKFNTFLFQDGSIEISLLPLGDALTLARES